jgi:UDP-glucose 4-epimerase
VVDFAEKNPEVSVSMLRFANVLGPDVISSHRALFELPAVPMILGFDPRYQFVHEDDVVAALAHVIHADLPGVFNVAADGVLALTEVIDLLGKRIAPVLPPWGTGLAATALRRLGVELSPEMLEQLRFGRGLDNRRLKATGFEYRYTTREAVIALGEHMRLAPIMRGAAEPYRYEREVEEFLRRSPHVRTHPRRRDRVNGDGTVLAPAAPAEEPDTELAVPAVPVAGYDDLEAEEIAPLLESLEPESLDALREHERSARARPEVLRAIERALRHAGGD